MVKSNARTTPIVSNQGSYRQGKSSKITKNPRKISRVKSCPQAVQQAVNAKDHGTNAVQTSVSLPLPRKRKAEAAGLDANSLEPKKVKSAIAKLKAYPPSNSAPVPRPGPKQIFAVSKISTPVKTSAQLSVGRHLELSPPSSPSPPSPPSSRASSLPVSLVNKTVGEEFQLLHIIGQGGDASVYLGHSVKDDSYVAVKALAKPKTDFYMQLEDVEIAIQKSLKHANIVTLHRVFQDDEYFYLVMELCDQGDLYDYFSEEHEFSVPFKDIVKQMFSQTLDSVEHMHANSIYHRDIKLENIFLKSQGEQQVVCKVGDFGLATSERFTMEFGWGSTAYLAPEHLDPSKHDRPYDAAASDVWSFGIVLLLLMFDDHYPWEEASDSDTSFDAFKRAPSLLRERLYPGLSSATWRLLVSMLALDGADRPSVSRIKEQFSAIDSLYAQDTESLPSSSA
ncbi:unnamed protein product [Mucor fragilis]